MFYYGQDTLRVTPKFTLNYGLRWEVYFPEYVNGKDKGGFANLVQGRIVWRAKAGLDSMATSTTLGTLLPRAWELLTR